MVVDALSVARDSSGMTPRAGGEPHHRRIADTHLAPILLSLPHGLDLGGVTTWAVRLANGFAQRGHRVAIIAHPSPPGSPDADVSLDPRVKLIRPATFPPMSNAQGDLSPYLPVYRTVIDELRRGSSEPVIFLPNILGDSYGLAAALCLTDAPSLRVVAWQHTDSAYDTALLRRYEPIIAKFVAIDRRYVDSLGALFPARRGDIVALPHGVEVPADPPRLRPPLGKNESSGKSGRRALRLIYTGRIEHSQKRIGALVYLADELVRRGVPHALTVMGDGPAAVDFDALAKSRPSIRRLCAAGSDRVAVELRDADAFVLPSRYEGLCISRIEAMAHGCVPIVTGANSGATTGLEHGRSAIFVDVAPTADEAATGAALADAVERFVQSDQDEMSQAAWRAAREHFSLERHVNEVAALFDAAATSAPRWWRASWAPAFSMSLSTPGGSGSTGPNAAVNLQSLLESLARDTLLRRLLIHGAGQHTVELASILARSPIPIVAITDDNPALWGRKLLGWTVIPPRDAATVGATDLLISSYIHADAIWSRRGEYERLGLRVHRVYGEN